ncbi:potassium-transporting ATPase subunit KdpA, partial [Vibrio fluvialis]
MLDIIIICSLSVLLAIPLGTYMTGVFSTTPHFSDKIFGTFENGLYKLIGVRRQLGMDWKDYGKAFLLTNLVLGLIAFGLLKFQH